MKKAIIILLLFISPLLLQGCGVAMVMGGISALKSSGARQREASAMEKGKYTDYMIQMEKLNMERESKGLEPKQILTLEEWLKQK